MYWRWRLWLGIAVLLVVGQSQEEPGDTYDALPDDADVFVGDGKSEVYDGLQERILMSPAQSQALHMKIDDNADGQLSMSELLAFSAATRRAQLIGDEEERDANLKSVDSNEDGKVSREELFENQFPSNTLPEDPSPTEKQHQQDIQAERDALHKLEMAKFDIADANKDGFLDAEELPVAFYAELHDGVLELVAVANMQEKDKDGNGELSFDELFEAEHEEAQSVPGDDSEHWIKTFEGLDKDRSGGLNLAEMKHWESGEYDASQIINHVFEVADKDKDLHITSSEFEAAQASLAETDTGSHLMDWIAHHEL